MHLDDEADGPGAPGVPPPVPLDQVDMEALVTALHSFDGYLGFSYCPSTGQVQVEADEQGNPIEVDDYDPLVVPIDYVGNRGSFKDMEDFVALREDADVADRLARALREKRPFRAFADAVYRAEDEGCSGIISEWQEFSEARRTRRALVWLREWDLIDDETFVAALAPTDWVR